MARMPTVLMVVLIALLSGGCSATGVVSLDGQVAPGMRIQVAAQFAR